MRNVFCRCWQSHACIDDANNFCLLCRHCINLFLVLFPMHIEMLCEIYKVSEIWSAPLRDAWVRLLIMQTFWCFGCFWQWHLRCTLVSLAFTPFGCKRFWRPGAHHLDHAVVNISFRLREDRQLDEHAGSRMVQSTLHNGILATAELEPHYSCHSRATAGLKRAASENCYFPQPSSWGLQLSMTTRLCFLRSLFKPSIICWYCQYCVDFFWRLNIQTTGCLLATGLGFFAHVRPLAVT